ncbi:MAG: MBL fold metallo-hydrolase [Thermoanaerobacteraceae bacterium]|nr:MBL fold metallo-hydrolase [Thermoanaerobacteraceae bacterium]
MIERLAVPTPFPVGKVNCYLVAAEPVTLIDCGANTPEARRQLIHEFSRRGMTVSDLEQIIITHAHPDHVGLAGWLAEQSGAAVYMHRHERDKICGNLDNKEELVALLRQVGVPEDIIVGLELYFERDRKHIVPLPDCKELEHGNKLSIAGKEFTVLHTPGHSRGHICLYHEGEGIIFSGDTLLEHISPNPVIEMDKQNRIPSLPCYLQSLTELKKLSIVRVFPGHGSPFYNAAAVMDELIKHHEKRKRQLAGIIEQCSPVTAYDLVQHLYQGLSEINTFLAVSEVLGHVDLLLNEGQVTARKDKQGLEVYVPRKKAS